MDSYDMTLTALGAVLIAVCSWISIPMVVPFTMQTFAVFCVLGLLGGKRGTMSILVYILLGAIGLPVFSGFKGGLGVLLGTTGGYIIGFIITGLVFIFAEKYFGKKTAVQAVSMLTGLALCYAFGTGWFMYLYARQSGPIGLGTALGWCVIPFIVPDLVKMAAATVVSSRLRRNVTGGRSF